MGRASSNKKVARAAKAGGGRARAAGERNLLFPFALGAVIVLGTLLVVYARADRQAVAQEAPLANEDHWHSSYGFYVCDEFLPQLPEFVAPQNAGTHTHGDGLIHIHPFATARAGENATLTNWLADAGAALGSGGTLSDDELSIPGGEDYVEGERECEGLDGDPILQVAVWDDASTALEDEPPNRIVTEDFGDIRFEEDGQAFTIAFVPEDTEIPPPPSTSSLADAGADLGVPTDEVPDDADFEGTDTPTSEPAADEGGADDATTTTAAEADGDQ